MIASDPALIAETRRALPALCNAARLGGGVIGVRRAMAAYFGVYAQPKRSDAEWAAWWFPYEQILADLPESAIAAGMLLWTKRRDAQFLPAPGQLLDIARHVPTVEGLAYARARASARLADNPLRSPDEPLRHVELPAMREVKTDETRAWARAEAVKLRAESAAKSKRIREDAAPDLPPTHGALAPGRNITPEMVELLERQGVTLRPIPAAESIAA